MQSFQDWKWTAASRALRGPEWEISGVGFANCQAGRLTLSPVSRCTWLIRFATPTGEL